MTASDASPFGLGVMRRRAPAATCAAVGRCFERWRYKVEGGHQARARSLKAGELVADEGPGENRQNPPSLSPPLMPRSS
eukprot:7517596-Pyramimonas_sp.AAC.1